MEKRRRAKKVSETSGETKRRAVKRRKAEADGTKQGVVFVFHAPDVREVYLTGEFNSWDTRSLPMRRNDGGEWRAEIELAPGRYEYNLFVDGVWVQDPACHEKIVNPFGTQNCVIKVS